MTKLLRTSFGTRVHSWVGLRCGTWGEFDSNLTLLLSYLQDECYQFGGIATGLDGIEVAHFFWNIDHTDNLGVEMSDFLVFFHFKTCLS